MLGSELSWHRVPDIPGTAQLCLLLGVLKAFQLKKVVRQDKDVTHCEGETLPSHRKPMASHALVETSGWPNLIKYSCSGFPNSGCESS